MAHSAGGSVGRALTGVIDDSFVHGMRVGLGAAAGIALVGAVFAVKFLPARGGEHHLNATELLPVDIVIDDDQLPPEPAPDHRARGSSRHTRRARRRDRLAREAAHVTATARRIARARVDAEVLPAPPGSGRPLDPKISEAILDATLDVLTETGYAKLSIEAVAQRAGVHRPAVYRRWPTKLDLVAAAISSIAPSMPDPATGDVRDDLVVLVSHVANLLLRSARARLGLRLVAEIAVDEELAALVDQRTVQPRRDLARRILERGIARGEIRPGLDMELVCDLLIGSLYARALVGRARLSRRAAEQYVDSLLDGLRAIAQRAASTGSTNEPGCAQRGPAGAGRSQVVGDPPSWRRIHATTSSASPAWFSAK